MFNTIISKESLLNNLKSEDFRIIDTRYFLPDPKKGFRDYRINHIPGAYYAHLDKDLSGKIIPGKTGRHPLPEIIDITQKFSDWGIDENTQVVVYDYGNGAIASRLWWLLQWLGHEKAAVLDGGWKSWIDNEFPQDHTIPPKRNAHFIPKESTSIIHADELLQKLTDPNYLIIDSRAKDRYLGLSEPIDLVAGHIKGAKNLPYEENTNSAGYWEDPKELKDRFEKLCKKYPDDKTIFYCGSGVTSCHNILAYKIAGLGNATLYPGSWSDWITDKERPIATDEE